MSALNTREEALHPDPPLVYVVDDDASVRRSLGRLIRSLGLRTREFESGAELMTDPERHRALALLVDVHMPRQDGYDLVRELAKAGIRPPVVFITAQQKEQERWRTTAPTAVACLVKPFSEHELMVALERALGALPGSGG